jgi:hypothetical protein
MLANFPTNLVGETLQFQVLSARISSDCKGHYNPGATGMPVAPSYLSSAASGIFDTQDCVNGRENYSPVRSTREIGARKCKSDHADARVNLWADFCVSPTVRVAPIGKQ